MLQSISETSLIAHVCSSKLNRRDLCKCQDVSKMLMLSGLIKSFFLKKYLIQKNTLSVLVSSQKRRFS